MYSYSKVASSREHGYRSTTDNEENKFTTDASKLPILVDWGTLRIQKERTIIW